MATTTNVIPTAMTPTPNAPHRNKPCRNLTLYPYQATGISLICAKKEHICFEWATGSGKTATVKIATSFLLQLGSAQATHVLVATTQRHIESAFTNWDFDTFSMPAVCGSSSVTHLFPRGILLPARDGGRSRRRIRDYLRSKGQQPNGIACTHAALRVQEVPESCVGKVLIIDEAQHAKARQLSKVVALWKRRGGRVLYFTATAFRGDAQQVVFDGMLIHRRSLAAQMKDGLAPSNLRAGILPIKREIRITAKQFAGEAPPSDFTSRSVAETMLAMVEAEAARKDGQKPKAMIRMPIVPGGSQKAIKDIVEVFESAGYRVYNATGEGTKRQHAFESLLAAERKLSYTESEVDIIVGIKRVEEGTDWVHCSHMFVYGLPRSATLVQQLLGRATRKKSLGHPWKDETSMRFFVETNEDETFDLLSKRHSEDVLAMAALLGDVESPARWMLENEILRAIENELQDERLRLDMQVTLDNKEFDLQAYAKILLATSAITQQAPVTVSQVEKAITDLLPATKEEASGVLQETLAALIYDGAKPEKKKDIEDRIHKMVQRGFAKGFPVSAVLKSIPAALLAEFREETLLPGRLLLTFEEQVHSMTGVGMQKWAARILNRTPLTLEWIQVWGDTFKQAFGHYPKGDDDPYGLPEGETWLGIDAALRQGSRGLSGKSSLAIFFGYYKAAALQRVLQTIRESDKPITSREIGEKLGIDHTKVPGFISKLTKTKYIRRTKAGLVATKKKHGIMALRTLVDMEKVGRILQSFIKNQEGQFTATQLGSLLGISGMGTSPTLRSLRKKGCIEVIDQQTNTWQVLSTVAS